jgi:teichuronic acid biosynthesis glycosyltransferase TuaC
MKWAIATQYWPIREQPYRGHSAFQTLRCLRNTVDLEAFSPQSCYPNWLIPRNRPWAKTDLTFVPPDIQTTYFHYPAFPVVTRHLNGFVCGYKLEPFVRQSKPDLILSFWIYPDSFAAVRVGRKLGIPVVAMALGTDLNTHLGRVESTFARWTLQNADMVLTVSHDMRRRAIQLGADSGRVQAILNGCDTSIFTPASDLQRLRHELSIQPNENVALYVGRLIAAKGLMELVRACVGIACGTPVSVVMVGEGPIKSDLEQLAISTGAKLRIVPPCSSTEVAKWMNAADVFCLPSYTEGCPNVIVEAMNCGRPIVATNVGGIPELVDSARGILVPPKDVSALAAALQTALARSWDNELIATRSRRSWNDAAREMYSVCQAVVNSRAAQRQSMPATAGS